MTLLRVTVMQTPHYRHIMTLCLFIKLKYLARVSSIAQNDATPIQIKQTLSLIVFLADYGILHLIQQVTISFIHNLVPSFK